MALIAKWSFPYLIIYTVQHMQTADVILDTTLFFRPKAYPPKPNTFKHALIREIGSIINTFQVMFFFLYDRRFI